MFAFRGKYKYWTNTSDDDLTWCRLRNN